MSTQNQPIRYFSVHCILAGLLSTHVCKFLREVVGAKLRNVCYMAMPFNGRFRVLACLTYTTLLLYAPLKIFSYFSGGMVLMTSAMRCVSVPCVCPTPSPLAVYNRDFSILKRFSMALVCCFQGSFTSTTGRLCNQKSTAETEWRVRTKPPVRTTKALICDSILIVCYRPTPVEASCTCRHPSHVAVWVSNASSSPSQRFFRT